jgi:voltage-gated potassium channel
MKFNKTTVRTVIFEADTPAGKAFDVALIVSILISVAAVMLDTIESVHQRFGLLLYALEWFFTVGFTIEYALRLWCIENTRAYARSFYGVIDVAGILPTYLSLLLPGTQYLLVIRILRVLRVFRVLRMVRYVGEAEMLIQAMRASRRKITVFVVTVLSLVVIFGSLMYLIEGPTNPMFGSIPDAMYWAVTTMTTVGFGDITPQTALGRVLATIIMIMGYGIIAVPTGIVTLELSEASRRRANTKTCPQCSAEGHSSAATYCWRCGTHMYTTEAESAEAASRAEPSGPE